MQKLATAGIIAALALSLVACATPRDPLPLPGEPTPTPTPTEQTLSGNPVPFTCEEALPSASLATLPQAWVADASFSPERGSSAEQAVEIDGFACGFTGTDGSSLVVAVANPDADTQDYLKAEFSRASDVTTDLFDTAFFSGGDAEVFPGEYWVSLVSPAFAQATDAKTLVEMIIQTIPSG